MPRVQRTPFRDRRASIGVTARAVFLSGTEPEFETVLERELRVRPRFETLR